MSTSMMHEHDTKTIVQPLAIDGGPKAITAPLSDGKRWDDDELKEVLDVFESGKIFRFGGEKVEALEREWAEYFGVKHAIASTSGTAAIHIAIGMINPEPGDEIIVAPINDAGGIVPVLYQGALPVFADIDPFTFCMDPQKIEANITPRTRAIMVVHLCGNPCDMDAILAIGKRHGIPIIEDCSQAHGARYKGKLVGTMGDVGCFSLQASKHITSGEGGVTITNNDEWAARGAAFMDKGWFRNADGGSRTYRFLAPNYRMTELAGAVALAQLRKLPKIAETHHRNGELLRELTATASGISVQRVLPECKHTYWKYAFLVDHDAPFDADMFADALAAEGVPAAAHYIGAPIFQCMDATYKGATFGESQFPFSYPGARPIEYSARSCPVTRDVLHRWVYFALNAFQTDDDIKNIATAILKVSEGLMAKHRSKKV